MNPDDIRVDPEDPLSVYRDRPTGQELKAVLTGKTEFGQPLELSFTMAIPDNVDAFEKGAQRLAHMAWHALAGMIEPELEDVTVNGEPDYELAEATKVALLEFAEQQEKFQKAFIKFMNDVYDNRPEGMDAKWN